MKTFGPRRSDSQFIKRLVAGIFVAVAVWAAGLIGFAGGLADKPADESRKTDAIVVLTGGSGRLDEGLRLLSEGKAERMFVSGVYRGMDVRMLLQIMKRDPSGLENLIGIGNATNTTGNAAETAEWLTNMNYTSIRLVTAGYHMPRSLLEFRHTMPGVQILAHPVFPEHVKVERWWAWPGTMVLVAGEYNKYLLAKLRHFTERLLGRGPSI
ncbi:MAG: YdcF family protein [Rhodospirillaceae bacterium]|nr:YdcF family protein [Rhodospirillaceae bacterium]